MSYLMTSPTDFREDAQASALQVTHVVLSMDCGGLESIVLDLVRQSRRLGQSAAVICLERTGALAEQVAALGIPLACVHKPPGIRLEMFGRLRSLFRELRPDVVHTHQVAALFYAGPAARRAGVPVVVHTEHGKHYGQRRRTRWLGRLAARSASRFFCVSADIAEEVQSHRIARVGTVAVVPNGIDTNRFHARDDAAAVRQSLGIPAEAPVIGTVGRLCEIKRQDLLLRAFGRVRALGAEASHLLIVGDGPALGELRALTAALDLVPWVHFAGYQAAPERYYGAMDVFALTSQSEGMPLSVLEAWAAGLPVVATRVGGLPELVDEGRTGILVDFGDEAALAGALGGLIAEGVRARRLGAAGRDQVEARFSLERMAEAYQRHYRELLGREVLTACGS
jgi:sugar transferase (PEP-CTERM/EpsH1 system associated)